MANPREEDAFWCRNCGWKCSSDRPYCSYICQAEARQIEEERLAKEQKENKEKSEQDQKETLS